MAVSSRLRMLLFVALAEAGIIVVLITLLLSKGKEGHQPPPATIVVREPIASSQPSLPSPLTGEPERAEIPLDDGVHKEPAALEEYLGYVVAGHVTDTEGNPIVADIVGFDSSDNRWSVKSRDDGSFALVGLAPGSWKISCQATEFEQAHAEVVIRDDELFKKQDFELTSTFLLEVVFTTPDGRRVRDLREEPGGRAMGMLALAVTDEPLTRDLPLTNLRSYERHGHGRFQRSLYRNGRRVQPPDGVDGYVETGIRPPFHVTALSRSAVIGSAYVQEGVTRVAMVVDPDRVRRSLARVRLRFVDGETGAPLTEGRAALNDRQSGGGGVKPDADGVVVLNELRPGLLVLSAYFDGYAVDRPYVRVEPGSDLDLGEFALFPAVMITGTVTDSEGKPVAASVSSRSLDRMTFPQPLDVGVSSRSSSDGEYKLGVTRGRHQLRFVADGRAMRTVVVDTSGGGEVPLDVSLASGSRVTIGGLEDCLGQVWQVLDESGSLMTSTLRRDSEYPIKLTLSPGRYRFVAWSGTTPVVDRPLIVSGAPLDVDLGVSR